jgi:hypothetical protein
VVLAAALLLPAPASAAPAGPGPVARAATTACARPVPFRVNRFAAPTRIDNTFLPLVPGTRFTLDGFANRGGGSLPHTVTFTVTSLTKVVHGVTTRVVLDIDVNEGALEEAELAFFAQDDDGNVWSMGEYPEEYADGVFEGAPNTWISGLDGARAGIMMLAAPKLGGPRYEQGSAPSIDFLDCAKVFAKNQRVCVPAACYSGVLVTDENSPLEPDDAHQRKSYAPGVGNVKIGAVNDPEGETLQLTRVNRLSRTALAIADLTALALDIRGHRVNDVYAQTPFVRF